VLATTIKAIALLSVNSLTQEIPDSFQHNSLTFTYYCTHNRKRTMSKIFSVLFLSSVASILFSHVSLAQSPSIEGDWKMSIIGENLSSSYSLIQKGNLLTGTFRAPLGTFPLTGTITKDNKVNFSAKAGGMNLKFAGTVDGKTMRGVADIPMKGRKKWTATKY
jgi:hypothetical protein